MAHKRWGFRTHQDESKSREDLHSVTKWRQMTAWLQQDEEKRATAAEVVGGVTVVQSEEWEESQKWKCDSCGMNDWGSLWMNGEVTLWLVAVVLWLSCKLSLVQGWLGLITPLWVSLLVLLTLFLHIQMWKGIFEFSDSHVIPDRLAPEEFWSNKNAQECFIYSFWHSAVFSSGCHNNNLLLVILPLMRLSLGFFIYLYF